MTNYRNRQYKPSKQFLQREFLTNDTTDDSENENNMAAGDSSLRSSTTTVNNMSISKSKRNKTISRHSSLGSSEYQQQQQQQQQKQNQLNQQINSSNNEPKRISNADVKRTSSLKQFHYSSDEGDLITDQFRKMATSLKKKKSDSPRVSSPNSVQRKTSTNERRSRSHKTKNNDEETMSTRLLNAICFYLLFSPTVELSTNRIESYRFSMVQRLSVILCSDICIVQFCWNSSADGNSLRSSRKDKVYSLFICSKRHLTDWTV